MALHVIVGKGPGRHDDGRGTGRARARRAGPVAQRRDVHRRRRAPAGRRRRRRRRDRPRRGARRRSTTPSTRPTTAGPTDWPPVAAALLTAAERTGAVLVTMSNLYGYGRPCGSDDAGDARWRPPTSRAGCGSGCGPTRSPRTRPAGCGSPRRGPRTSSGRRCRPAHSHLTRQLPALRKGRRAWVVGDPDAPRTWAYLPDVAATLATLGTDERALGRAWHVPSNAAALAAAGARRPRRGHARAAGRRSAASRGRCCGPSGSPSR